jgi:glyoxylase-like metal-dependent hydrolase (beta-lactamase superfamily II)
MIKKTCTRFVRAVFGIFFACTVLPASVAFAADAQLTPVRIAPGVYVVYGDPNPPSYDNDALTVNIGIVVTSAGVAIIDSGPSYRVAQMLDQAVQKITSNSIKYVINTGPEPARWLGNSYFKKLGIPIVAHTEARKLMEARGAAQLQAMKALLKGKAAGTELALPRGFSDDSEEIRFSDSTLQLSYFGPSQSPGTIGVWLPRQQIAFAGAIMQSEVLPALTPDSQLNDWIAAFDGVAALRPIQLVPGRGTVGDIARMRADTRDYLVALRDAVTAAKRAGAGAGAEPAAAIAKSKELAEFKRLQGYSTVGAANIALALQQSDSGR